MFSSLPKYLSYNKYITNIYLPNLSTYLYPSLSIDIHTKLSIYQTTYTHKHISLELHINTYIHYKVVNLSINIHLFIHSFFKIHIYTSIWQHVTQHISLTSIHWFPLAFYQHIYLLATCIIYLPACYQHILPINLHKTSISQQPTNIAYIHIF